MNVLMICTEKNPVPPIRGGAVQTYIQETAQRLAGHHKITVLGVADPELPTEQELQGVSYVRVPRGNGTLKEYESAITDYLRERHYDIIHIFNRPLLVLPVRSAAPNARLILSMHNDMFELAKIAPAEAEGALEQLERIICVSNYVGSRIATLYPQAGPKLQTIYSGVDLDRFAPRWSGRAAATRKALWSQHRIKKGPVILFVGRLSPKKGADVLLHAMAIVARQYASASLILVGSKWYGSEKVTDYVAYLRALAARSPAAVVSTGFVQQSEVQHWFWASDLLVCASQWQEPLARVHYEAMAAGLPIVTTDRGGNAEVVRGLDNGMVVDAPNDPKALAQPILKLAGDSSLRDSLGRRGRALAEERFGWDRVVGEILAAWR